ncbi:MAG: hypothetical protein ACPKPY_03415 [Nitrososphaeraceae archaeon]
MTKEENKKSKPTNKEPESINISTIDTTNNSLSTSKIWQDKVKRRKEAFQIKGINSNIFRISKAGRIIFTKRQRNIIKQIVMDAMIQQLPLEQSLIFISDKLGLYNANTKEGVIVSQSVYYYWYNIIKKEYLETFDYYQKDKYAYISEYMQRIQEIKRITHETWKLFDNNIKNPHLQRSLLADLKVNTILLNRFYDMLPVVVRQPKEFYENLIRLGKEEEEEQEESSLLNINQDDNYNNKSKNNVKSEKEKKFERAERKYQEQKQNAIF